MSDTEWDSSESGLNQMSLDSLRKESEGEDGAPLEFVCILKLWVPSEASSVVKQGARASIYI